MSDLFFIFRTIIITVGLIILMQVKVGSVTIEERAESWVRTSVPMEALNDVAKSGVIVFRKMYQSTVDLIDRQIAEKFPRFSGEKNRAAIGDSDDSPDPD